MYIDPFINVRTTTEFLYNVLSDRKIIGRHMINNVRIRARKKTLELDHTNTDLDSKHFDTTTFTSYQDIAAKYNKGKLLGL